MRVVGNLDIPPILILKEEGDSRWGHSTQIPQMAGGQKLDEFVTQHSQKWGRGTSGRIGTK